MIKNFYTWLYCNKDAGERVVIIKGINHFIVDNKYGGRQTWWPVWDWKRVKHLLLRISGFFILKHKFRKWNFKRKFPHDWYDSHGRRHRSICFCCGKKFCDRGGTF